MENKVLGRFLIGALFVSAMFLTAMQNFGQIDQAEAATTLTGIYNASGDYSGTQGYRGWYYLDGAGKHLTYNSGANWWQGPEAYQLLFPDGGHPGTNTGVIRRWKAPSNANLRIMGNAHDTNPDCGDGVTVSIKKGLQVLWQKTIANGDTVGSYFDFDATASKNSVFDFVITKDSGNNWCDATYFDVYIVPVTSKTICPDCLQFKVGPAVKVLGPAGIPIDNPFIIMNSGGKITGYTANSQTFSLSGPDLGNLTYNPSEVIGPGDTGDFDECGAWLQAVVPIGNIIRGWYHAEKGCDYSQGQTDKSVGYAESYDGGKTFTKANYPNNQVLKGITSATSGMQTGAGDQTVTRWKDYFYMYFLEASGWHTGVARSNVTDGGKPGTWWKWYNNGFNAPGLSNNGTTLGFFGQSVSHNALYDTLSLIVTDKWFGGLRLSQSKNTTSWSSMDEPLLITEDEDWARDPADKELIVYPSIITPAGNSWVNNFYLFYTYLQPGEDSSQRYLVYRKVDVTGGLTTINPQVRVELNNYTSGSRNDSWSTNTMVLADYVWTKKLGYTFTKEFSGSTPLFDCYMPSQDDHMVSTGSCGNNQYLRKLGWIWATQKANTLPLYSCNDAINTDRFSSNDQACEGKGANESLLGYIEQ